MKEYNLQTKKWEVPTKIPKAKPRALCRGKKEHDYVLVIPKWYRKVGVTYTHKDVKQFYLLKDQEFNFNENLQNEFEKIEVEVRGFNLGTALHYVCSVCGKEKIVNNDNRM